MGSPLKSGNTFYGGGGLIVAPKFVTGEDGTFLPVAGGRSSQPDNIITFAPNSKLLAIPPDFAVEWLTTLENLAAYNPDISYALDNIVQLANTKHDIFFSDKVGAKEASRMKQHLIERESLWYENSGGIGSLKSDLLTQIVINGALSAEAYPDKKLKGVDQVVRVTPKYIRFVYNGETGRHDAYQTGLLNRSGDLLGMTKLNPATYQYIALRRYFQSPYATPPFLSAVDSLCIQKDMLANFKNIMQKLGMLGFLSAEVTPPVPRQGESQEAYFERCSRYLSDVVYPQLEKNLGKGMVAGFTDKHKFTLQGNNMNVQGADGLFNLIQSRVHAGVKQDPNMLGVKQATTETFGRVILAKLLSQTTDYQRVFDKFWEKVCLMELRLAGFSPGYVQVVSQKPMVGDIQKEEEAESKKIDNVLKKRNAGIISQEQSATELGYDEPYSEGDIAPPLAPGEEEPDAKNPAAPDGKKTDPANEPETDSNLRIRQLEYRRKKHVKQYDYCNAHDCGQRVTRSNFQQFDVFEGTDLEPYVRKYFDAVYAKYRKASKDIGKSLGDMLLNYSESTTLEVIQRDAWVHILTKWESEFVDPVQDVVGDNITRAYEKFRKDKGIFEDKRPNGYQRSSFKVVPDAVLDFDDFRAIEFMESSDSLYLGKFITDADTKRAVYKYMQEQYLEGYLPIGNNKEALAKFQNTFAEQLNLEAWKIRRIIDTTMNKVRNYASIYYMKQASVESYEIVEMLDNLTCGYCSVMNGLVFSVTTSTEHIQREVNAGAENIGSISPFLTSVKLADLQGKTADQIQSLGFNKPPYHPHCRGMVVAVF